MLSDQLIKTTGSNTEERCNIHKQAEYSNLQCKYVQQMTNVHIQIVL